MGAGIVYSFTEHDGYLYVGGSFYQVGDVHVWLVGRWDGESWSYPGFGLWDDFTPQPAVYGFASCGDVLAVGGDFQGACWVPSQYGFVTWDGDSLRCLGDIDTFVITPLLFHDGILYIAGLLEAPGVEWGNHVAAWDGEAWTVLGGEFNDWVADMMIYKGRLVVGGKFTAADGVPAKRIASWDGSAWAPIGGGLDGTVRALASYRGELVAAGGFSSAGDEPASRIASWDGNAWHPLGSGFPGRSSVYDLAVLSGELFACGDFTSAGGAPGNRIAAWNGQSWRALGSGLDGGAYALCAKESDSPGSAHLYVGGFFQTAGGHDSQRIARWDPIARSAILAGREAARPGERGHSRLALIGASPTPFRESTSILFHLDQSEWVRASAFDIRGRLAGRLFEGAFGPGPHSIDWEGRDAAGRRLPAGIYFVRIVAGPEVGHARVILAP